MVAGSTCSLLHHSMVAHGRRASKHPDASRLSC